STASDTIISGGRDAMLLIWKKVDASWQHSGEIPAHLYTVKHLSLSPDGLLLASASRDKSFKICDAQTLKLLKVMYQKKMEASHSHSINRLLWLDDSTLLTTGDDKKIIAWRID